MNESLLFDVDKAVAILTINDEPYNRMSLEFMDDLELGNQISEAFGAQNDSNRTALN